MLHTRVLYWHQDGAPVLLRENVYKDDDLFNVKHFSAIFFGLASSSLGDFQLCKIETPEVLKSSHPHTKRKARVTPTHSWLVQLQISYVVLVQHMHGMFDCLRTAMVVCGVHQSMDSSCAGASIRRSWTTGPATFSYSARARRKRWACIRWFSSRCATHVLR